MNERLDVKIPDISAWIMNGAMVDWPFQPNQFQPQTSFSLKLLLHQLKLLSLGKSLTIELMGRRLWRESSLLCQKRGELMPIANSGEVTVDIDGVTYTASYTVWKNVVTVEYKGRKKSTQVGGMTQDGVAKMLLREMVRMN